MTNVNTHMRKGFTMIELIFVIVIIGILAAVAIPKLAANKDDAVASTCLHEIGQVLSEASAAYTASANSAAWNNLTIADVTNVTAGITANGSKGIVEAGTTLISAGFTYNCDSTAVTAITFGLDATSNKYGVTSTLATKSTGSAAAATVYDTLFNQYGATDKKTFTF